MAILSKQTIGNIHLLEVDDTDPNGAVTAPVGSLAIQGAGAYGPWVNTDGATAWKPVGPTTFRKIAADSMLDASGMATAEAAHTAIPLLSPVINTVRTVIDFYARLMVNASVGADTWRFRARLGGLGGVIVADSTVPFNITNNDVFVIRGSIQITAIGAGGFFDATSEIINYTAGTVRHGETTAGAINTTGTVQLVITGLCDTANVNQLTLTDFHAIARR